MCEYCNLDDDKWTTYEKKINLGVLGKESYITFSLEGQQFKVFMAVNNESFTKITTIKIKYCPFCGRKL